MEKKEPKKSQISTTREKLKARSNALAMVRAFFKGREVIEADVPALTRYASIDSYIDLIETTDNKFLHSSPEYALKRLLCENAGDIFFLGHVYRKEEDGKLHNSEFTMIEWYRVGTSEEVFLDEVIDLLFLFLGEMPVEIINFESAFQKYAKPICSTIDTSNWSEDEKLFYQWATDVEPNLGSKKITIVTNFLPEHASLAKTHQVEGKTRARRYEFYYNGVELANGFDELPDPKEHKNRFEESNQTRLSLNKKAYPIDQFFLDALQKTPLPKKTFGMAAGFDRLLMFKQKKEHIKDVLPFSSLDI